jgi:glycosyltransferase involved in cell wall biosynthesis
MKIIIVQGPYYPVPSLLNTGAEKVWQQLGEAFVQRGHEVLHLSRQYAGLADREIVRGVTHVRLPSTNAPRSSFWYRLLDAPYSWRAYRKLAADADIVVTNCMWLPLFMRFRLARKLYVHVARMPKGQMRLYRHAARLLAVSSVVADAIRREVPQAASRVSIVPPCLTNNPPESMSETEIRNRSRRILYLGRLHPEKGVHLLMKAFARLRASDWVLEIGGSHQTKHGGGGEGYLQELQKAAATCAGRVEFSGMIPQEQLNNRYWAAAVMVYPSLAETGESFGMAPLEAMGCGCAAVVSDLACFRDYLVPGVNGFVFDHRSADPVAALTQLLQRVIDDEPLRSRVAAAGHRAARDFTVDRVAERYLEDFAKVAAEHPAIP